MTHSIAIIIIVILVILIIDPYVALWQMQHSGKKKINDLEWSINELSIKLAAIKTGSSGLQSAQNNFAVAKNYCEIAKQEYIYKKFNESIIAAEVGLNHTLKVWQYLNSN